ncbi:UPF0175 family protein [Leeuwenhoekiella parthenopeia]|uniref:UPF0175 family protein n=1 Tax=Leeuwenhoekiella parthenopeia TaxID=2890320 RepID=A0ABS8GPI2_9FLAO|nr:UPF0175 family protein [Leeuwenhoekiella parthenopeia]MCC4211896.1 UPF0175 family protein [Leeuwenhoekiella parthenopeia]
MKHHSISLDFPADILLALNESEQDFKNRIKLTLAIQLYKLEKLTLGKAAQLSGISRMEFENELVKNGIPISNLSEKDILSDLNKLDS